MKQKSSSYTIGIDLGDKKHAVCVLDVAGEIVKQEFITNNRASLTALHRRYLLSMWTLCWLAVHGVDRMLVFGSIGDLARWC